VLPQKPKPSMPATYYTLINFAKENAEKLGEADQNDRANIV